MKSRTMLQSATILLVLAIGLPLLRFEPRAIAQDSTPTRFSTLDVIFVVDQSGSMFLWSDPTGTPCLDTNHRIIYQDGKAKICDPNFPKPMRQTAAQYLIDYLSVEPLGEPRVGVVYFGTEANVVVPLFNITDRDKREQVIQFLEGTPDDPQTSPYWWWTNTNKAFDVAYQELFASSRAASGRTPVIIFLSDGHPDQPGWDEGSERILEDKRNFYERHKQWVARFEAEGVPFFTILMALTEEYVSEEDEYLATDPELKSYVNIWQHMATQTDGGYYRVHEQYDPERRRRELLDIYHAILAKLRGVSPITTIEGTIAAGERRTIKIPRSDCRSLIVEVHRPSPQTQVALIGPNDQRPEPEAAREEYVLYSVRYPEVGDWELVIEGGEGKYYIRLDCAQTELLCALLAPPSQHPQCKGMRIAARLESEATGTLSDGWVDVLVTLPDGSLQPVSLNHKGEGIYEDLFRDTQQRGEYKLEVTGRDREGQKQPVRFEQIVSVLPLLYLDFVEPVPGGEVPGGDLVIRAALKIECDLVKEDPLLSKDTTIHAILTDNSGNQTGSVRLRDDGDNADEFSLDGIFSGVLPDVSQGDYVLSIDMVNDTHSAYDSISGLIHVGLTMPTITPTSTPRPTITPTPGPTPTPVRAVISLDKANLGRVRAGQTVRMGLHLGCAELEEEQTVTLELDGVPFELDRTEINAPPGRPDYSTQIGMRVPEELDPRRQGEELHQYEGRLRLTYPDGKSSELSFTVEVLPPPTPSWIYLVSVLGLVAVVASGIGAYRWQTGKGQLTGKLVYADTPRGFEGMAEEELFGEKRIIVLDEEPEVAAKPTQGMLDYGFNETTAEEMALVGEEALEVPESLHTELIVTARRGRTEARIKVNETNTQVLINDVPLEEGAPPHELRDGDAITAGRYALEYQSLTQAAQEDTLGELAFWDEEAQADYDFDEQSYDEYGGYGSNRFLDDGDEGYYGWAGSEEEDD